MPDAIVLGAGMAGVPLALQLRRRGWSVALVDRLGPGRETSYGNAGIIQAEAVIPYAMPRGMRPLLDIVTGRSNDVLYHVGSLWRHLDPIARYWWHSAPARLGAVAAVYSRLIAAAAAEHAPLIEQAGAESLVRRDGYRLLHRSPAGMEWAIREAERLRSDYGVPSRVLDPAALAAAEPVLRGGAAGAVHWLEPWTVNDPGALVAAYADLFVRLGGTLARGDASSLQQGPARGWSVDTEAGRLEAEHAVVALGPWAPDVLRRFGFRFPMVRKRGYHLHYDGTGLDLPIMDAAHGYVVAPMAKGLRITTGAELAGPDAPADTRQLRRAERAARELLDLGTAVEREPWIGTRPCMPDMLPVLGPAKGHPGLWLHFGHGHQGLTLGPATGRILAEMMAGETAFIDPAPLSPDRY